MTKEQRKQLRQIHSVLDKFLGDIDISYIEDDEQLKEEEPVFWAAMQLALVLNAADKAAAERGEGK